jgi:hypothetical protein
LGYELYGLTEYELKLVEENKCVMRKKTASRIVNRVPKDAVLLIPEPENADDVAPLGVKPGYYSRSQLIELLETHQVDGNAVRFIADMLESGDAESDAFAHTLRANAANPMALADIIKVCKADLEGGK